jgi:tetratricopeptide (TPR) repeat protein
MMNLFKRKPPINEVEEIEIPKVMETSRDYFNRGMVYYGQGQYEEALGDFLQAVALDQNSYDGHYGLGLVYKATGRSSEAHKAFEEVLRLADALPEDVDPNRVAMLKRITQSQLDNLKEFMQSGKSL